MKISVITQDQTIVIDGEATRVAFAVPAGEWAIHFDTHTGLGEVEFIDSRQNALISDFSAYQYLIDLVAAEQQRVLDAEELQRAEALENEAAAVAELAAG